MLFSSKPSIPKVRSWPNTTLVLPSRLSGEIKDTEESEIWNRHVTSDPVPLSEGSVVAYYLSEFRVPVGQEAAVDKAMAAMEQLVNKEQRSVYRAGNSLMFDNVVSSGTVWAVLCRGCSLSGRGFPVSVSKTRFLSLFFFFFSSRHANDFRLVQP